MIKLECNDDKILKVINNLFEQKDLIYKVKSDQYFVLIKIRVASNNINIDINGCKINLSLPIDIILLVKYLNQFLTLSFH